MRAAWVTTNTLFFFLPYPTQLASNPAVVDSSALTVKNMSGQEQSGFTFSATDVYKRQPQKITLTWLCRTRPTAPNGQTLF